MEQNLKIRPLIITSKERAEAAVVVQYAENHVLEMDDLLDIKNNLFAPPGNYPEHVCFLPVGYRVVFSIERQNHGLCRHISISVDTVEALPSVASVELILPLFGINAALVDCILTIGTHGYGKHYIDVIEP